MVPFDSDALGIQMGDALNLQGDNIFFFIGYITSVYEKLRNRWAVI